MRVVELRAEHVREPLGLGTDRPRLSWRVESTRPGAAQTAYEIGVHDAAGALVTTGRVESAEQVLVDWPAPPLASREIRSVRVRVWANTDISDWSDPLVVEAGLLSAEDWQAAMIGPDKSETSEDGPAMLLRRAAGRRRCVPPP